MYPLSIQMAKPILLGCTLTNADYSQNQNKCSPTCKGYHNDIQYYSNWGRLEMLS
jgi:hypothetical protein